MTTIKILLLTLLIINNLSISITLEEGQKLKSTETVDLYILNSLYEGYLEIPKDKKKIYQIDAGSEGTYIVLGYSVEVNELGTVTPSNKTTYYYEDGTVSDKFIPNLPINKTSSFFSTGSSIVMCKVNDNNFNITVIVHDYAQIYTEDILNNYVKENVKDKGTQLDQFTQITEYISQYPYNPNVESYISLIILKSGNHWAYSSAIDFMAKSAGIQSHMRVAENDGDEETILMSVVALINDEFYVSKILFDETNNKNYTIYPIPQGYSIRKSDEDENNIIIYQYDGFEENIIIPNKLDNKNVIGLDRKCFSNGIKFSFTKISNIIIPEGIISIGDETFSDLYYLIEINFPKSVRKIGYHVFDGSSLENIYVDKENNDFSSDEGILYNKNKTILINYPPGKYNEKFNVPEGLEKIGNYSFYKNEYIKTISLSKSLNYIGREAFGDSSLEEIYFKEDPPIIGEDAFLYCIITIYYPKNNKKWSSIIESGEEYGSFYIDWVEVEGEREEKEEEREEEKEEREEEKEEREEEIEEREEEKEDNEKKNDGENKNKYEEEPGESNAIIWILIVVGIVIILLAIIFLIIIKRKDKTSESIESLGGEGLLKEQNELSL